MNDEAEQKAVEIFAKWMQRDDDAEIISLVAAEIARLKAERDAAKQDAEGWHSVMQADLDAAFVRGLERAKECLIPWLQCKCDAAYTDRGRHESNAWHELAEEIDVAIDAEIARAKAGK